MSPVLGIAVAASVVLTLLWLAIQVGFFVLVVRDQQMPSVLALSAWALSLAGAFTGPFVLPMEVVAMLLAGVELYRVQTGAAPASGRWVAAAILLGGLVMVGMVLGLVLGVFAEVGMFG